MKTQSNASYECFRYNTLNGNRVYKNIKKAWATQKMVVGDAE